MPRRTSYAPGVPCWVDCLTPDPVATTAFYAELFGWHRQAESQMPGYALLRPAENVGPSVIGGLAKSPGGGPASWTSYLACSNLSLSVALAAAAGCRIILPPVSVGSGSVAIATDPAGGTFGFFKGASDEGIVLVDEVGALSGHVLLAPDPRASAAFYQGLTAAEKPIGAPEAGRTPDESDDEDRVPYLAGGLRAAHVVRARIPVPTWVPVFGAADLVDVVECARRLGARPLPIGPDGYVGVCGVTILVDPAGALFGVTTARVTAAARTEAA